MALHPFALGDVPKRPNPSVMLSVLAGHRRGISVQDRSVDQLDFVAADLVRMRIEIGDFIRERLGILYLARGEFDLFGVILVLGDVRRYFPKLIEPLVL